MTPTILQVGEPLTPEGMEYVLFLMAELEAVRLVVGGEGHDNMGARVAWALRLARGERAH